MPLTIIIDLEPNLFRIGPFLITWHGVFAVLGIRAAARLGLWLLGKEGIDVSRGADGVGWMVVLGLIGARVLYVWENYKQFSGNLLRILAITEGGISQWGGLFGAMVGVYVWSRRAAISFWAIMDAAGPATMIGLAIGRIGDVINGEHHGTPTNAPWGVEYVNADTLGQPGQVVHPEVAYEMILTLVLFGAILPFHQRLKKKLPVGVLGLIYLGLYAVGRFFLSYYRTDPAVFAGLRQAQLASLLMVVIAVIAIPILFQRRASTNPVVAVPADEPKDLEPVAVVAEPVQSVVTEPEPIEPAIAEPEAVEPVAEPETVLPAPVVPQRPRKPLRPKTATPDPAPTPTDPDPSND
jgi:phosphatidylglycerol---prolipoprotein diacylglyceryl transferase